MGVYAIALDPGETTGVALARWESDPFKLIVSQMSGEHHLELYDYLRDLEPEHIICETFVNVGNQAARLAPCEYIGVVKLYSQSTGCSVVWQSPSTGKVFWNDERLKRCGLYVAGLRHARDAIRHYAHWRVFALLDTAILEPESGSRPSTVTRFPSQSGAR